MHGEATHTYKGMKNMVMKQWRLEVEANSCQEATYPTIWTA